MESEPLQQAAGLLANPAQLIKWLETKEPEAQTRCVLSARQVGSCADCKADVPLLCSISCCEKPASQSQFPVRPA